MKTITVLLLALLAATATASEPIKRCEAISSMAHTIMYKRQAGVSMSVMMAIAEDDEFIRAVVIAAYSEPRWSTERNKVNAANDFRDDWALACYTGDD